MTTPYENFVNIALGKALSSDVTLPTADKIPVFTGIGRQVTGKTKAELGLALTADLGTAASADVGDFDTAGSASTAQINAQSYADGLITSVYKVQGSYNPQTTGNFPTSANTVGSIPIKQAFIWIVSGVFGQYTFQGVTVNNGDTIVALIDNPSATTSADWHITESNLGYTPENQNNKDTDGTLADNSDTKYPSQKAVKTYADTKQAALADVITADTYGSSTQYPVITFNAKGIATGVTLQTPTFTDATFSVQKNGSPSIAATWSLSALTESRVHTYPDKDIDFKTLSSVGASDSNTLSGTRNRIVGGNGNNVSGTDVVVINSTELLATSAPQGLTVIGGFRINSLASGLRVPAGSIILGSSRSPDILLADSFSGSALGTISCLYTNRISSNGTFAVTADGETESTSNSVRFGNAFGGTVFDVDFIVSIGYAHEVGNTVHNRTLFARRRVFVLVYASNPTDLLSSTTLYASTVTTPESDQSIGGTAAATVSVSVTVDTTNKMIVPKVTFTASGVENAFQASVRVTAHCSRKA